MKVGSLAVFKSSLYSTMWVNSSDLNRVIISRRTKIDNPRNSISLSYPDSGKIIQGNLDITNSFGGKRYSSLYRKCMEKDGKFYYHFF